MDLSTPWHLVPTVDLSAHSSSEHVNFVKHRWTTRAACITTSFSSWLNTVYSEFWLSGFSVSSRCSWNRSGHLITHDVLDPFTMFSTCRSRSPAKSLAQVSLLCDPRCQLRTSCRYLTTCSSHAFVHLPLSQVFRAKSAGFSHLGTLAMVSSRRTTAFCTHKIKV